jgi:hypothetical protein
MRLHTLQSHVAIPAHKSNHGMSKWFGRMYHGQKQFPKEKVLEKGKGK